MAGFLAAVIMGGGASGAPLTALDTEPDAAAVLSVEKSAPEQVNTGSQFDYEIEVTNTGDGTATDVVVTDALPADVDLVSLADGCYLQDSTEIVVVCDVGSIEPSGVFSTKIHVTVPDLVVGTIENTAEARAANADPVESSVTTVVGDTSLSIDKSGPASAAVGARLTYEIAVENTGAVKAFGVDVEDFLPDGVSGLQFDERCHLTAEDTIVFCDLGDMPAGSHQHVEISFIVDEPGEVTNQAQVSGSNMSTDPEDSVTTAVADMPSADLELEKSAPASVDVGDDFEYTITVRNVGSTLMTGVRFRDPLPAGLTFKSATGVHAGCTESGGKIECALGDLGDGDSRTVTIDVQAETAGVKVNTASVRSFVEENGPAPNSDSATTTVAPAQSDERILIFGPTDTPALQQAVTNAGFVPVVVSAASWGELTTADFREYRAILLGDPFCGGIGTAAAAVANASVWGAAVNGSVIIDGTDPVLHGRNLFTDAAVRFASSSAGRTGAYVSLSCYYHGTSAMTPVPLLDAFEPGGFAVTGVPGCFNDAHIVADHPALTGLSDEYLSGWGCSVHEAFDSWPDDFLVLAIARNVGSSYTAPDGTVGTPYILARGEGLTVISDITASTAPTDSTAGMPRTVSAKVVENAVPQVGKSVSFRVISGPHAGTQGAATTDGTGTAVFSYTGTTAGTDAIEASYVDSNGATQTSNRLFVTWILAPAVVTKVMAATVPADSTAGTPRTVSATVVENDVPQAGKSVSFRVVSGPHAGTQGAATTDATGTAVFSYTGTTAGTDAIEASYLTSSGAMQTSNRLVVTWVLAAAPPLQVPEPPPLPPPLRPPPPPEEPGTFNAQPTAGVVLMNGEVIRGTIELESGDVVDATNGTIAIVSDSGRGEFFDGAFKITQPSVDDAITRLELVGGDFSTCSARKTAGLRADEKPIRRLWGKGTGKFQTKSRYSSATVGGTTWLSEDHCDGSLTVADDGSVTVFDFSLRRTRVLAAGEQYFAEEPPPPAPGRFVGDVNGQVIVNGIPVDQDTQIRSGDTIDVRNGTIQLTTTSGDATFFSGRFQVTQTGGSEAFTVLTLIGGDFSSCARAPRKLSSRVKDPPKKNVRSLWGKGTGKFRTESRYSSATVGGTNWLTVDRCGGSLTVVYEGIVEVFDLTLRQTVQVAAGQRYFARSR